VPAVRFSRALRLESSPCRVASIGEEPKGLPRAQARANAVDRVCPLGRFRGLSGG